MLDWIERLLETVDKRIQDGFVVAIAFFLAMALKYDMERRKSHDTT